MKINNILNGSGVLLIVSVILLSNLSITANFAMDTLTENIQADDKLSNGPSGPPVSTEDYEDLLKEDFTSGKVPPDGWELKQTNSNYTWYNDSTDPYSEPYCVSCYHDNGKQDEWLITPSLNFSGYTRIYLRFHWYTSYYEAVYKDYHDLNVSISTDGGSNWTLIWNEDDLNKPFQSWQWYDTNNVDYIDLTDYINETDVKIGFQYYSPNGVEGQEYSIDDIELSGNSTEDFWCDTGGPYEYHWDFQPVKFHGSVGNGQWPYTSWLWDFGDGVTSSQAYFPAYSYDEIGTYNVSLEVRDSAGHISYQCSKVDIYTGDPPEIQILDIKGGVGIEANIKNVGTRNATYIEWKIAIQWGPLLIFEKEIANGNIESLAPKTSQKISIGGYFIGFGRITICISAEPENALGDFDVRNAYKIGPFVIGVKQL
jgi:hypothetical protein